MGTMPSRDRNKKLIGDKAGDGRWKAEMSETIVVKVYYANKWFLLVYFCFLFFFFRMKDLERVVMSNVCGIQSIGKVKLTRVWFCIMLSVFYSTNF